MSKPVIVVDPGHGGRDPGAIGPTGLKEKNVTLAVAYFFKEHMARDAEVILTRYDDTALGANTSEDLAARVSVATLNKADIFISFHANSFSDPGVRGKEVYTSRGQTEADRLAEMVINSLDAAFPEIPLRADRSDGDLDKEMGFRVLVGVEEAGIPGILMELAFISNPSEEKLLADPDVQNRMAAAVARGAREYLGLPENRDGRGNTVIELWVGKNVARLNGEEVGLDQAPEVDERTNRSLMPVRFVAESLGATVEWDGSEQKITITRGER